MVTLANSEDPDEMLQLGKGLLGDASYQIFSFFVGLYFLPFNLICNMTTFRKKMF